LPDLTPILCDTVFVYVNPARHADVNYQGAQELITWITSPDGPRRIVGLRPVGEQLFFLHARGK
jgi:tungstate transport system substrate-binding protein